MNRAEILKKALDIAKKNGFRLNEKHRVIVDNFSGDIIAEQTIIFDHDFCKAFFHGTDGFSKNYDGVDVNWIWVRKNDSISKHSDFGHLPNWLYRLHKMVSHDDPLLYLEQFL